MEAEHALERLVDLNPAYGQVQEAWRTISEDIPAGKRARLVELLAEEDLFRWLPIIRDILPGLVARKDFAMMVRRLADKCAGDMAAGPFLDALREAGMRAPDAAKEHVAALLEIDTPPSRLAAALLVAGIAIQDERWAVSLVVALRDGNGTPAALRVMESLLLDGIAMREALTILFGIEPRAREERALYASCLRISRASDPARVDARFVALAEAAPSDELVVVAAEAAATLRRESLGADARRRILELSFERGGPAAAAGVDLFGSVYRDDATFVVELLTRIARERWLSTHLGLHAEALLHRQARAIDREPLARMFEAWIGEEGRLPYQAPDGLLQLHEGHERELLDRIRGWGENNAARFAVRLKLLQDVISRRADPHVHDQAIADATELGRSHSADTPPVLEGESDPKWRALRMIQHLLYPVKNVDYEALQRNLDLVPHVRDFMGASWWASLRAKAAKDNLLPHLFHRTPPTPEELGRAAKAVQEAVGEERLAKGMRYDHLLESVRVFEHWERVFARLDPAIPGLGNLRRKLKNPPQVADALCEAEITSGLIGEFTVQVEPDLPGLESEPDLLVHVLGQDIVMEIYNPKPPRELRYASGTHGLSLTRIRGLVLDKYRRQFKEGAATFGLPVVIVINASGSTLDDFEFEAVFKGSPKVTITIDRETGESSSGRWTRGDDHIGVEDEDTRVISGILGYRRNLTGFAEPRLTLDYYPNPAAKNPLLPERVHAICGALGTRPLRP